MSTSQTKESGQAWTPGPWRRCGGATPYYSAITSGAGYIVFGFADTSVHREGKSAIKAPDVWEQMANAQLISAAPSLAEAAAPLVAEIEHYPPSMGEDDDEPVSVRLGDLRALAAALAKARGQ